MAVAGIDVGAETTKAVILDGGRVLSHSIGHQGRQSAVSVAASMLDEAAQKAGVSLDQLEHVGVTGIGREQVNGGWVKVPEPSALARGIPHFVPSAKTVLDIGAQKALAVGCVDSRVRKQAKNEKCASGSGLYLEVVCDILGVDIDEMGALALTAEAPVEVAHVCTVFAESEIISLIHVKRERKENIVAGVLLGMAKRLYPLVLKAGMEQDVAIVGGVAKNRGVLKFLEQTVGFSVLTTEDPEIVGAVGAAVTARALARAGAEGS
jgi:predicted CoA-substrate-specific enzyme activase